jgi:hypothetical protein
MSYWIAFMRKDLVLVVRIERQKFIDRHVRHRERIVGEVDLLLLLAPLVHREVDDPAQFEAVLLDQVEVLADFGARGARELHELLRLAGDEEHRVAVLQAKLRAQLFGPLGAEIVGDRPAADHRAIVERKEDIAEPRLALALRP